MKKKKVGMTVGTVAVAITLAAYVARKRAEKQPMEHRVSLRLLLEKWDSMRSI